MTENNKAAPAQNRGFNWNHADNELRGIFGLFLGFFWAFFLDFLEEF